MLCCVELLFLLLPPADAQMFAAFDAVAAVVAVDAVMRGPTWHFLAAAPTPPLDAAMQADEVVEMIAHLLLLPPLPRGIQRRKQ